MTVSIRLLGVLFSFLLVFYLNKNVGVESVGKLAFFGSMLMILVTICKFGTEHLIVKSYAEEGQNRLVSYILVSTMITLVTALIILFINDFIYKIESVYYLIASVYFVTMSSILSYYIRAKNNILTSTILDYTNAGNLFKFITAIVIVNIVPIFDDISVSIFFWSSLVLCLISIFKCINDFNMPTTDDFNYLKNIILSAWPLFLSSLVIVLNNNADKIIIMGFSNAKELGLYDIAYKISSLYGVLFTSICTVLSPLIAKKANQNKLHELKPLLQKFSYVSLILCLLGLVFLMNFGDYLLSFLGVDFNSIKELLYIFLFAQAINLFFGPVSILLIMINKKYILLKTMLFSLLINVVLLFLSVRLFGGAGAAYVYLMTMMIQKIFLFYKFKIYTKINYLKVW